MPEPAGNEPTAFTAEQRGAAREAAAELLHLLEGADGEGAGATGAAAKSPSKRSMADVADRVLDIVGKGTASIVEQVEKASPVVWEVMVKQQFWSAVADMIAPLIGLIATPILTAIGTSLWARPAWGSDGEQFAYIIWVAAFRIAPLIVAICFLMSLADALTRSIKKLGNARFYAMRALLQMLLGRNIPE